ncbi:MAG: hypothetical protein JNJ67_07815 [Chromatiales bacterium]|nr:hypothetical protein [Chromatiales bacterium]
MRRLPQSAHHPHAFREVVLASGQILGLWADPVLDLASRGDWRVACAFSRPLALDDFLVIPSWTGVTWRDVGVRLSAAVALPLSPNDRDAFQTWLSDEATTTWLRSIEQILESAVSMLQATAVTALLKTIQQPQSIHLDQPAEGEECQD